MTEVVIIIDSGIFGQIGLLPKRKDMDLTAVLQIVSLK